MDSSIKPFELQLAVMSNENEESLLAEDDSLTAEVAAPAVEAADEAPAATAEAESPKKKVAIKRNNNPVPAT